jgi:hypothetical protein
MYQILELTLINNHAHASYQQTPYFFLFKENAEEKVQKLLGNSLGKGILESFEKENGSWYKKLVNYSREEVYKIVEIVPEELKKEEVLPF